MPIYSESYQLYKPNAQGTGGGFSLSYSRTGLYVKIAKQIGTERRFDWEHATVFKLDFADIAQILAAIESKTKADLFHDASKFQGARLPVQKGLTVQYNEQYHGFYWSLWRKEGEQTISAGSAVSLGETQIIVTLLRWVLPYMLKWNIVSPAEASTGEMEYSSGEYGDSGTNAGVRTASFATTPPPQMPTSSTTPSDLLSTAQNIFGTPTEVGNVTEKVAELVQLAKTKLGATNAEDAKLKLIDKTKLAFVEANLDAMLIIMRGA